MWFLLESYKTTTLQPTFVGNSQIIDAESASGFDPNNNNSFESKYIAEAHQSYYSSSSSARGLGWDGFTTTSGSAQVSWRRSINSIIISRTYSTEVNVATSITAQPITIGALTTSTRTDWIRARTTTTGNVVINTVTTAVGNNNNIYFAGRTTNTQSTVQLVKTVTVTETFQTYKTQTLTTGNEGTRIITAVADTTFTFIPQPVGSDFRRPRNDVIIVPRNSSVSTTTKYPASSFSLTSLISYVATWTPPLSITYSNTTTGFSSEFDEEESQVYNRIEIFDRQLEDGGGLIVQIGSAGDTREFEGPTFTTWTGSSETQSTTTTSFIQPLERSITRTTVYYANQATSSSTYAIGGFKTTSVETTITNYENSYTSSTKTLILPDELYSSPLNPSTWQGPDGQGNIFAWPWKTTNATGVTVIFSAKTSISSATTNTTYSSSYSIASNHSWTIQTGRSYHEKYTDSWRDGTELPTAVDWSAQNGNTFSKQTIVQGVHYLTFKNSAGDGLGQQGSARLDRAWQNPYFIIGDNRPFFRAANPDLNFENLSQSFPNSFAVMLEIQGAQHSVGDMGGWATTPILNGGQCPIHHKVAPPLASFTTFFSLSSNFASLPTSARSSITISRVGEKISSTWNYLFNETSTASDSGTCKVVTSKSFNHGVTAGQASTTILGGCNYPHQSLTIGIATDSAVIYTANNGVFGATTFSEGYHTSTVASSQFIEWRVCPDVVGEGIAVVDLVDDGLL